MQFTQGKLNDTWIIQPKVFQDDRGYFFESFRAENFRKHVGDIHFIQDNESKSTYGVLRGLHYQLPPFAQSKLVRVVEGKILDVAVDIRQSSDTFGRAESVELSAANKKQFFIPKGFAHGFVVLSETAIVQYKVDAYYSKEHERGIRYDDPELGIDWRIELDKVQLSEKDLGLPQLNSAALFE
ncbi:MAG: dTDP-4-dehydrorhamnose 3,5-epimerase [Candidatus Marinimicrobia bacterium]|nr:dTDP-4-dehydrorhamnose 3,5-epimerase [Candidatus Neomarinimicrobiota bacterium]